MIYKVTKTSCIYVQTEGPERLGNMMKDRNSNASLAVRAAMEDKDRCCSEYTLEIVEAPLTPVLKIIEEPELQQVDAELALSYWNDPLPKDLRYTAVDHALGWNRTAQFDTNTKYRGREYKVRVVVHANESSCEARILSVLEQVGLQTYDVTIVYKKTLKVRAPSMQRVRRALHEYQHHAGTKDSHRLSDEINDRDVTEQDAIVLPSKTYDYDISLED